MVSKLGKEPPRVVFDTSTVLSALLFANGRLAWLRAHWRQGRSVPLVSKATADELIRVLGYSKFQLSADDQFELMSDYLPFCRTVEAVRRCPAIYRGPNDQMLLDLAESGDADLLVTSDGDLLALKGQTSFEIESPEEFRRRVEGTR